MSSLLYKGHSIIYRAALDPLTRGYVPTGQLVWHGPKGKHATHSYTLAERFNTASLAEAAALKEAISWADERLAQTEQESKLKSETRAREPRRNENQRPDISGEHGVMASPPRQA
jgi:hypothetical protein